MGREPAADLRQIARIGIIGDVHTEDVLLERAITELRARGAELVLCVGDISDGPGDLARCCDLLQRHEVLTVRGNHDRWLLRDLSRDLSDPEERGRLPAGIVAYLTSLRESIPETTVAYLTALPATRTLHTHRGVAMLCHGLDSNDMASVGPDDEGYALETNTELHALLARRDAQIVFNGHTHRRMVRHFDGLTIVNAGTLHPRHGPGAVLADLSSGDVSWLDFASGPRTETAPLGSLVAATPAAPSNG